MHHNPFQDLDTARGLARDLWPRQFREGLGVRSPRTIDKYVRMAGFPAGTVKTFGCVQIRVWTPAELGRARVWLESRRRAGSRAGQLKIENLHRLRTSRAEVEDLVALSGRLLRRHGADVLAGTMRRLGLADRGFERIPDGVRAGTRTAIVRAIELGAPPP